MEIIGKVRKMCLFCMEEHEISIVRVNERTVFKGVEVHYDATYEYCDECEEFSSTEEMMCANDIAVKAAYRSSVGLLTPSEIIAIRSKYDISQSDFCTLLGWGAKTIARYETHQVQTASNDAILRKIDSDPEWFLQLLYQAKGAFSDSVFRKYYASASKLFADNQDNYLRKSIEAQYTRYEYDEESCGGTSLNLNKVVEAIRYFANSVKVSSLYKVKTMKMLWYSDALSYKRYGHSMTGLVYRALPMGAVPIAHESIIDLKGISIEEIDYNDGVAYHFIPSENPEYSYLSDEDFAVLDVIIDSFGRDSKDRIVNRMHAEEAYDKTPAGAIISYSYALNLSIS